MNAFASCRAVEVESRKRLRPFIEELSGGHFVALDDGPLAVYLQQHFGDIILERPGSSAASLELKAEEKFTGNIFAEVYSNLASAQWKHSRRRHAAIPNTPGWLFTSRATLLAYHFLDNDDLIVGDMLRLKKWAFGKFTRTGDWQPGSIGGYTLRPQRKREQLNITVGALLPIRDLVLNCGGFHVVRVNQGELFEKPFDEAA